MNTPPAAFALALGVFAIVWFLLPDQPLVLAAAILLGAFWLAEDAARKRGIPGPLAELRGVFTR
jgi:hypothetical protein